MGKKRTMKLAHDKKFIDESEISPELLELLDRRFDLICKITGNGEIKNTIVISVIIEAFLLGEEVFTKEIIKKLK
jgi:hypothetical protein